MDPILEMEIKMEIATKDYIIHTVFKTNILPLLSGCNTSCIFCSHKQNPENVRVYKMPKLRLEDFDEITDFLCRNKKIIIGESATRIVEGEPLLHPDFTAILALLRRKFAHTPIQITTNGILLCHEMIDKMVQLGNIELNISVNCVNAEKRKKILGLAREDGIVDTMRMLDHRLKFSGSSVFVPGIMEARDVEEAVALCSDCGAESFRLFLPGYTRKTDTGVNIYRLFGELRALVDKMRDQYPIPVIIEPSFVTDLECRIEGVIRNTPADTAGLRAGDIILEIDGIPPRTRVEGFNRVFKQTRPSLLVRRQKETKLIRLAKKKNSPPGFILLYDIDPEVMESVITTAGRHKAEKVLFMTSEMAKEVLVKLLHSQKLPFRHEVLPVRNNFFGGTIKCAGLLTIQDMLEAGREYVKTNEWPDLILLPPVMFDYKRTDLLGKSIRDMEAGIKIPVDTV